VLVTLNDPDHSMAFTDPFSRHAINGVGVGNVTLTAVATGYLTFTAPTRVQIKNNQIFNYYAVIQSTPTPT